MPGLVEGHCHLMEGGMWDLPYLGWFDRRDPTARSGPACARWTPWSPAHRGRRGDGATGQAREPLIAWGFDPIYFGGERMTVDTSTA